MTNPYRATYILILVTRLIRTREVTHSHIWLIHTHIVTRSHIWLIHTVKHTSFYVWRNPFIRVPWLIHTRAVTNSYIWLIHIVQHMSWYVWRDLFIRVPSLIHTRAVTNLYARRDSFTFMTQPYPAAYFVCLGTCDASHSYACRASFISVPWFMQIWSLIHIVQHMSWYAWRDSSTRVLRLVHIYDSSTSCNIRHSHSHMYDSSISCMYDSSISCIHHVYMWCISWLICCVHMWYTCGYTRLIHAHRPTYVICTCDIYHASFVVCTCRYTCGYTRRIHTYMTHPHRTTYVTYIRHVYMWRITRLIRCVNMWCTCRYARLIHTHRATYVTYIRDSYIWRITRLICCVYMSIYMWIYTTHPHIWLI